MSGSAMESFVWGILFLIIIGCIFCFGVYVLVSAGIYRALRIYRYHNAWMAWIPVLRYYALCDAVFFGWREVPVLGASVPVVFLGLWPVFAFLAELLPVFGVIAGLCIRIFLLGTVCGHAYAQFDNVPYESREAVGFISGWIPIAMAVKFLCYPKDLKPCGIGLSDNGHI